jgi:hypothetical protein
MAHERATITFADDTKRLRIGLSVLDGDGKRKPIWVSFTAANYDGTSRERIASFEGPGQDAATSKRDQFAWDTRIKELQDAEPSNLSKSAYEVWKYRFGPVTIDPVSQKHNKKRRQTAQDECGSSKKQRMASESPVLTTEAVDTTELKDEQLEELFYSYEQDVEVEGLRRVSKLLQAQFGSSTPIPVTTLARMRKDAKAYAMETPELIWGDHEFLAWKDRAIQKEEESTADKVQPIKSGVAYAEFRIKMRETMELVEAYRKKWLADPEIK